METRVFIRFQLEIDLFPRYWTYLTNCLKPDCPTSYAFNWLFIQLHIQRTKY